MHVVISGGSRGGSRGAKEPPFGLDLVLTLLQVEVFKSILDDNHRRFCQSKCRCKFHLGYHRVDGDIESQGGYLLSGAQGLVYAPLNHWTWNVSLTGPDKIWAIHGCPVYGHNISFLKIILIAHLCTKFQDDVWMTRRLFTMVSDVNEDELRCHLMRRCVKPSWRFLTWQ